MSRIIVTVLITLAVILASIAWTAICIMANDGANDDD